VSSNMDINAFLGAGAIFEGALSFTGMVRVDCEFTGNIESEGSLVLGEKAVVKGVIRVRELVSNGNIHGDVHVTEKASLRASSDLEGDIYAPVLNVEGGALIRGNVFMTKAAGTMPKHSASPDATEAATST